MDVSLLYLLLAALLATHHRVNGKSATETHDLHPGKSRALFARILLATVRIEDVSSGDVYHESLQLPSSGDRDTRCGHFQVPRNGFYRFLLTRKRDSAVFGLRLSDGNHTMALLSLGPSWTANTDEYYLEIGDRITFSLVKAHQAKQEVDGTEETLANEGRKAKNSPSRRKLLKKRRAVSQNGPDTPTCRKDESKAVAFSVASTKSFVNKGSSSRYRNRTSGFGQVLPADNGRLTFDKTFVNEGFAFRTELGEFVAPVKGVYYFSFTVGKYPRKYLSVSLMKNDNLFQVLIYNDSKSRRKEMQGQNVMLKLLQGDTVWLKTFNRKDYAVFSNHGNYITFNGYLLHSL